MDFFATSLRDFARIFYGLLRGEPKGRPAAETLRGAAYLSKPRKYLFGMAHTIIPVCRLLRNYVGAKWLLRNGCREMAATHIQQTLRTSYIPLRHAILPSLAFLHWSLPPLPSMDSPPPRTECPTGGGLRLSLTPAWSNAAIPEVGTAPHPLRASPPARRRVRLQKDPLGGAEEPPDATRVRRKFPRGAGWLAITGHSLARGRHEGRQQRWTQAMICPAARFLAQPRVAETLQSASLSLNV